MKKATILAVAFVFSLITPAAYGQNFGAVLTGAQEPQGGDPDGVGTATVTFNANRTEVTFQISFSAIGTTLTGGHIHRGVFGVNGSVVIGFIASSTTITNGRIFQTVSLNAAEALIANEIIADPAGFYVNLHTPPFGGGAIRGQLSASSTTTFVGDLKAARETPTPGPPGGSGSFTVSLNEARTQVNWAIAVEGIGPDASITLSHIHRGAEGVAGPFVVDFTPTYVNGKASGTVPIDAGLVSEILSNPAGFYVNVHTSAFPGGAVRGQLVASNANNTVYLPVIGRVSNATETFVTDARIFNPSFTETATVMIEFFPGGGSTQFATETIPPRGTAVLNDIVGSLFGTTGIGGARITSSTRVVATSRIFSDRRPTGGGTVGQFFTGVTQPLRRGILTPISHLPAGPGSPTRTNVGLFNQNDVTVAVRLELRDAAGNVAASTLLNLAPRSFRQDAIDTIFSSPGFVLQDGTLTFDASSPIVVYASVVDSVTTDPVGVQPVEDPNEPTAP